ncbi:hypothetical protein ACFLZJ_01105 [Nanoarchaeota archaeon]
MNWKEWVNWKQKKFVVGGLFIIAYLLTIPIRDYSSYSVDISQGVPIWLHLVLILIGLVVIIIGLTILEAIVKFYLNKKRKK